MTMVAVTPERQRILILGAGFGGITAALLLARARREGALPANYQIILVNSTPYHLYTPALYEIAALPKDEAPLGALQSSISIPLTDITDRFAEIHLRGETVVAMDPVRRVVAFASGDTLEFRYAIVALGAETNYFSIPGLEKHALTLKTFPDAVHLRNRMEELIRRASRRERMQIVVGGGGATGVEFSAEAVNFICRVKGRRTLRQCYAEVILIEASETLLPGFPTAMARTAEERLADLGIAMRTQAPIARVTRNAVVLKDRRRIPYHLFLWAGGVRGASVLRKLALPLDRNGGVSVDVFLAAAPGIYAIGDSASFRDARTGQPLPRIVPVAEAQARTAVRNIIAAVRGQTPRPFRPLTEYPSVIAVGGKYAIANLVIVRCAGVLGWVVKHLIELRYLSFILPLPTACAVWLKSLRAAIAND